MSIGAPASDVACPPRTFKLAGAVTGAPPHTKVIPPKLAGTSRELLTFADIALSLPWMANVNKKKTPGKAIMLGVGLDSDGHKRVTTGPNFLLAGGSEETHEVMTEKVIKINEKLTASGKRLEDVSHEEFDDIVQSLGWRRHKAK